MIDREQIRAAEARYAERIEGDPGAGISAIIPNALGKSDLMSVLYLERGVLAAKTVCRITVRASATVSLGHGTGSLVSPRLLLTNHHVLRDATIARFSVAEFDFQETLASPTPQPRFFALNPDAFFLTDPELDFTLVAVNDPEEALRPYGWNRLVERDEKVQLGEAVTIIQHPRAETKQVALRENAVVEILEQFLLYRTDTAPGSSGAPLYNDDWELIGLHHSGVPRRNGEQILTRAGEPWTESMSEDLIDWIANEGARIDRIVRRLKDATLSPEQAKLRAQCFEAEVPRTNIRVGGIAAPAAPSAPAPAPATEPESSELQAALATLQEAQTKPYYDSQADGQLQASFYSGFTLPPNPGDAYDALHELLEQKHTTKPKYKPSTELYPWIDLQPTLKIRSIYSGLPFEAEELIRADLRVDAMLESMREQSEESLALLEAALAYNCEHVVPQSWFGKQEPMRGDLHHLFACETRCNGFRGNTPYFDFTDVEEAFRDQCGRSEQSKFEPVEGKGPVARATLYFLVRYPSQIDDPGEYDAARIAILKRWHSEFPPAKYEKHRNWAIHERQGNRNPFIDHPEWVSQVDFTKGLS